MSIATYTPGRNSIPTDSEYASEDPARSTSAASSGARGIHARFLQGVTQKHNINNGPREEEYRNTLARMLVRVDGRERDHFLRSIGDDHTRSQLAPLLTGDPTSATQNPDRGRRRQRSDRAERTRVARDGASGYLDFFIEQVTHTETEKYQVSETLADNYVVFYYGKAAPVWQYQGTLLNTVQDDQATNFFRLYTEILRGTELARRQKLVSLKYDSYIVTGTMMNLQMTYSAQLPMRVPFGFQLLVKSVAITNYTRAWEPTRADTAYSLDLNAVPFDGRPRVQVGVRRTAARLPPGAVEAPGPQPAATADPRTTHAPPSTPEAASTEAPHTTVTAPATAAATATPPAPRRASTANTARTARPETANPPGSRAVSPNVHARITRTFSF